MGLHYRYTRFLYNLRRGIWQVGNVPLNRQYWRVYLGQRLYVAFHGLFLKEHWMSAAQLTFNTLMAIIPVFAIVYAIANGFGFGDLIVEECRKAFASQPKIADAIVTLSKNYIHYTHTGIVLGISFAFMLYSVLSLFNNIETVFNRIWETRSDRSIGRTIVDYTSMLFIVPICVIFFSGISVFFYSIIDYIPSYQLLTPVVKGLIQFLIPLGLLTLFFIAAYTYIPNTTVKLQYVLFPSVLAAVSIILLQMVFVHFQILFTSYSIIYGSLAALPLLMLWMQISWSIVIGFAELAHANQEIGRGNRYRDIEESMNVRLQQCAIILSLMCERQSRGGAPMTMKDLVGETHMGYHSLRKCLTLLKKARYVHGNLADKTSGTEMFVLSRDSRDIMFGKLYDALMLQPHGSYDAQYNLRLKPELSERMREIHQKYINSLDALPVANCAERIR